MISQKIVQQELGRKGGVRFAKYLTKNGNPMTNEEFILVNKKRGRLKFLLEKMGEDIQNSTWFSPSAQEFHKIAEKLSPQIWSKLKEAWYKAAVGTAEMKKIVDSIEPKDLL